MIAWLIRGLPILTIAALVAAIAIAVYSGLTSAEPEWLFEKLFEACLIGGAGGGITLMIQDAVRSRQAKLDRRRQRETLLRDIWSAYAELKQIRRIARFPTRSGADESDSGQLMLASRLSEVQSTFERFKWEATNGQFLSGMTTLSAPLTQISEFLHDLVDEFEDRGDFQGDRWKAFLAREEEPLEAEPPPSFRTGVTAPVHEIAEIIAGDLAREGPPMRLGSAAPLLGEK